MNKLLRIGLLAAGVIAIPVLIAPMPEFGDPLSTVVEASDGTLLGARIADDGQWRFPAPDSVPEKFEKALLAFEDRYFHYHPGINPVSIARALAANIRAGSIVSGGSTITMQVARLARKQGRRTYSGKLAEMLSALRLELFRSKDAILIMYAANAPFGGNTVGLEAAARRYTGKPASELSWAEAASLAVLPNSPSLVYPGRNSGELKEKRDRLLEKLSRLGHIDSLTLVLALDEPLPVEPSPLPSGALHLTDYFYKNNRGERICTTIDPVLQDKVTEIINLHQKELSSRFISNSACIIVDVKSGNVLAYVGNSNSGEGEDRGSKVDIIRSERSTGSILKPLLYAAMLSSGEILPNSLIADIPTRFPGFSPVNFDLSFSGAVPASQALSQSLNIPAVKMLQKYDPERFLELLRASGFRSFDRPAAHYGLSLILGGGETSLWELSGVYASLSRVLGRYLDEGKYSADDFHEPVLIRSNPGSDRIVSDRKKTAPGSEAATKSDYVPPLTASSIWLTYTALLKVNRPETETGWQYFSSSPDLAWKTGTSYGFRDAWAVGTTPSYVVAVWAGNAGGEGRPGLTGIAAAAPILFDIVNYMGTPGVFSMPADEMTMITVCRESGFRAGPDCPETEEVYSCTNGLRSEPCPYHRIIHLNSQLTMQVNSGCADPAEIVNTPWFVLPPAMEYFYRLKNHGYKKLPPVSPDCHTAGDIPVMEFIYPTQGIRIFIPRGESGERMRVVAEVAHREPGKKIHWHLDDRFIVTTRSIHQAEVFAGPGEHLLTVVDEDGNSIRAGFTIIGR